MRLFPLLGLCLVSSCSLFGGKGEGPAELASKPRLVGRIALVPPREDFVLIESYGPWGVPDGAVLSGVGTDGRTCNLVVTGEKLGQHAAADLRSGVAKVGDAVYYRLSGNESDEARPGSVDSPASSTVPAGLETQKTSGSTPLKP